MPESGAGGGTRGWVVAALVCAAFWVTALVRAHAVESPPRELAFVDAHGKPVEAFACTETALADGEDVWQRCHAGGDGFLVRAQPARGMASLVAPLPATGLLFGVAKSESGDLAVLTGKSLVRLQAGRTTTLNLPDEASFGAISGMDWMGGDVELVFALRNDVLRAHGDGWIERPLRAPAVVAGLWPQLLRAIPRQEGWKLVWTAQPEPESVAPRDIELLDADESGTVLGKQIVHVTGSVFVAGTLDGAPGNVTLHWPTPWLELREGRWQPLDLPPGADRELSSSYVLHPHGLEPIPRTGRFARVHDRWIPTGSGFPSDDVVPAVDGGVWRLDGWHHYVRLDENGRRMDAMGFVERLTRLFRRGTWAQRLVLFWALFLLPLLAGAARVWRRLRESRRVTTWYTIAAVIGGWWVWTILADL